MVFHWFCRFELLVGLISRNTKKATISARGYAFPFVLCSVLES